MHPLLFPPALCRTRGPTPLKIVSTVSMPECHTPHLYSMQNQPLSHLMRKRMCTSYKAGDKEFWMLKAQESEVWPRRRETAMIQEDTFLTL